MIVYRIASPKWARDLSGTGAKLYGGRWNSPGIAMLYTGQNISLAMLEILVNATRHQLVVPFAVLEIEIPDDIYKPTINNLPTNWDLYPHSASTQEFGNRWIETQHSLALSVPSSANVFEQNILINPLHPLFNEVKINSQSPLYFTQRLYSNA